jgi:hypothetical protein
VAVPDAVIDLLRALEHSGFGQTARSSGWLYPLANMAHVLGAALLVGAIATFDIQVLCRSRAAGVVLSAALPIAISGFCLQVASGVVLFSAEASTTVRNPAFQLKLVMIVLGLANVAAFYRRFGWTPAVHEPLDRARVIAAVSLASWILVLLAGRAIAYV